MTALTTTTELALTLFRLKDTATVADYRTFSRDVVRPGMFRMPAVVGFLDYSIEGGLTDTDGWQLVELIAITSKENFEINNSTIGAELAAEWEGWVEDFRVFFLSDLLPQNAHEGRTAGQASTAGNAHTS